jgi:hypothetical protein
MVWHAQRHHQRAPVFGGCGRPTALCTLGRQLDQFFGAQERLEKAISYHAEKGLSSSALRLGMG